MVDYSKWDSLDVSDDEDEMSKKQPVVTRLDKPMSVTIPGKQALKNQNQTKQQQKQRKQKHLDYSKWDKITEDVSSESEDDKVYYEDEIRQQLIDEEKEQAKAKATTTVGHKQTPKPVKQQTKQSLTVNGVDLGDFFWSQTADNVILHIKVPPNCKAKHCSVQLTATNLIVKCFDKEMLNRQFAYKVWNNVEQPTFSTEQQQESNEMEWEMKDYEFDKLSRYLVVSLSKSHPVAGLKQWWDKVFVDDKTEFDIKSIKSHAKKIEKTQKVWNDAQEEFKRRIANVKPMEI